jgi:hypothetical protein
MKPTNTITEDEIFLYLERMKEFDGLRLIDLKRDPQPHSLDLQPDCFLTLDWKGKRKAFVVEFKSRSTPSAVREAAARARRYAKRLSGKRPMIVVPYLRPEAYDELIDEGVSALDLCGNGIVHVPGEWLVRHTGEPNRYRESAPVRNAYKGAASLVARVLLLRPQFESVSAVRDEIERRGGEITLGTVSKALKALEEELVVSRQAGVKLLQARKLLDELTKYYVPPPRTHPVVGRADDLGDVLDQLAVNASRLGVEVAAHDPARYVSYETATPQALVYASSLKGLLDGVHFEETKRFSNLTIVGMHDAKVFFDLRPTNSPNAEVTIDAERILWTSPLEVYLELANGDGRARQTATRMVTALLERRYE